MSGSDRSPLENFGGLVRLFPLPNQVAFPQVVQLYHVFEPRYRAMLEEALRADGLLAIATLLPGWEADYEGRPPIAPVACLGQVASHHRLLSGSYNILFRGLRRIRILRELPPTRLFREAEAELCEDIYPVQEAARRPELLRALHHAVRGALPAIPLVAEQLEHILQADIPLATLLDRIAAALDLRADRKLRLLHELNVHARAELLLQDLVVLQKEQAPGRSGQSGYPPEFSAN